MSKSNSDPISIEQIAEEFLDRHRRGESRPSPGEKISTLRGHTASAVALAWSTDSARLASASFHGLVRIWNPLTENPIRELRGHAGAVPPWLGIPRSTGWRVAGTTSVSGIRPAGPHLEGSLQCRPGISLEFRREAPGFV
jgi:WD40 repeat protein